MRQVKTHINGVPVETLAHAYELITIGATLAGVSERLSINRQRLCKAIALAKRDGISRTSMQMEAA